MMMKRIEKAIVISMVIFSSIMFIFAAHISGHDRTINVIEDTFVSENYSGTNYGSDDFLRVGNDIHYGKVQAFYYFDVSSLPDDWIRARISVRFNFGSDIVDVGVNVTYDLWDEMSLTWNNKPNESVYQGHILCDGFDFGIPLKSEHIVNDRVGVFLYGMGGETDGYIQTNSKEGASSSSDIAWIELHYFGIDPRIINGLSIAGLVIGIIVILILVAASTSKKRVQKVKRFDADWINVNIRNRNINPRIIPNRIPVDRQQIEETVADLEERIRNLNFRPGPNIPNMPSHMRRSPASLEKKINKYLILRFENNRTIIYVAGRRIIQCVHLILNIPKRDVPMYDEIDSIDEAADIYRRQGRNIAFGGHLHRAVIPPDQEFWGHCSNIQAWVENDYDTRILMSNLAFPLLRELTRAGDPIAKRVYKEEIALRLESGYPSVVQYLLTQGYIGVFTPSEFKSILEATAIIKNLSSSPGMLNQFLRSCFNRFPTLIEDILLQILELQNGKNIIFSIVQKGPVRFPLLVSRRNNSPLFINSILANLKSLLSKVEEEKTREDIFDCINKIKDILQEKDFYTPNLKDSNSFENLRVIDRFLDLAGVDRDNQDLFRRRVLDRMRQQQDLMRNEIDRRPRIRRSGVRCSFCGRTIPRGQDTCEWCGHGRDDDDDFFPYPFIFRRPGGGGSMKGNIAIPVNIKA